MKAEIKKSSLLISLKILLGINLVLLGAGLLYPQKTLAASYDFYVDGSYEEGDSDGSEDKPFIKIKDAIEAALEEDSSKREVLIKEGDYSEDLNVGRSVRLVGENKDKVKIRGRAVLKDGASLERLTFLDASKPIAVESGADGVINECVVRDFESIGIRGYPGSGKITVRNSKIYNGSGKGMYIEKGREIEIIGNEVYDNSEEGIDLRASLEGVIKNNNIHDNGESGIEIILGDAEVVIEDNELEDNGSSGISTQFYESTDEDGEVTIRDNYIGENEKYGVDCGSPSGGSSGGDYWSNSMILEDNIFEDNELNTISSTCNMDINGDSTDSDEEDQAPEPDPTPSPRQPEPQEEEPPALEEVPEREGPTFRELQKQRERELLEQEVEEIISKETNLEREIKKKKEQLESRSSWSNFFWGPDWRLIQDVEEKVRELESLQVDLERLSQGVSFEDNWPLVEEANLTVKPAVEQYKDLTNPYKERFSLLGWLFKSFYFKQAG